MSPIVALRPRVLALALCLGLPLTGFAQDEKASLTPPAAGETAQSALAQIQQNVNRVQTLRAEVEMSEEKKPDPEKAKKNKAKAKAKRAKAAKAGEPVPTPNPNKVKETRTAKVGPMEIARGRGARVALSRKDETKEYIANASTLWVYDHKDKEAKYIPTSLPFISGFVASAFSMDVLAAMDPDSLKLRGTQVFEGEPCWVIEGKSPSKLSLAGVEPTKMKFWVSKNDGIPRKIGVPSEDDLEIVLRNVDLGATVPDSTFQFEVPAGVKSQNIFGF